MRRNALTLICTLTAAAVLLSDDRRRPGLSPGRREARDDPHAARRREGGQRRRQHPGVGRRPHEGPGRAGSPAQHYVDPFAGEKPLFTINAQNAAQYADKLSDGHKAMLKAYPSFRIPVYPSHRTAAAPQRIYDATKKIAATAKLAPRAATA